MPSKFPATFSDTWLVALYQFPSTGTWPFTCFILEKLPTGRESGKLFSTHPNPSQSNPIINHPPPSLSPRRCNLPSKIPQTVLPTLSQSKSRTVLFFPSIFFGRVYSFLLLQSTRFNSFCPPSSVPTFDTPSPIGHSI